MCGIAGILAFDDRALDPALAQRMATTLARRGPDGLATHVEPGLCLSHSRLAIVDVAGGTQPMCSDDGVVLVANAEIYNQRELRSALEHRGYAFRTHCDVETILHGYRAWGDAVVERLHGMFAFAIWDRPRRRLLLARDRLGQKPLYTLRDGGRFLFASEPKAILAALDTRPGLDPEALARYLLLDFVPTPRAIFRGMHKLPAAHVLTLEPGSTDAAPRRYWRLPLAAPDAPPLAAAMAGVVERFDRAVERRLMSDVPVGLLLSGGLDSALVGASLDRAGVRLSSFSLGFDHPEFDESAAARATARWLGTEHHQRSFDVDAFHAALPDVLSYLDEPFADPSLLAVHALSAYTARHVKVVLGGDGADELFGGYDVFVAAQLNRWTAPLAPLRRRAVQLASRKLAAREHHFSMDFRVAQYARALDQPATLRGLSYTLDLDLDEIARLAPVTRDVVDPLSEVRDAAEPATDELGASLRAYEQLFLESDILTKIDRAGMAHGLEIRSPFLDHELVEYVAALPATYKVRGLSGKWLLKRALGPRLPRAIARRGKRGFSLPIVKWVNGALRGFFDEVLLDPASWNDGLVDRAEVERLLQLHRSGRRNLRKPLWNLTMLALWKSAWT